MSLIGGNGPFGRGRDPTRQPVPRAPWPIHPDDCRPSVLCYSAARGSRAGGGTRSKGVWPRRLFRCPRPYFHTGVTSLSERKSSYSYADLLACGHGNLFGPGNAQLPLPPMLMFDLITKITDACGAFG